MNDGKLRIVGCLAGLAGVLVTSSALAQTADAPAATTPAPPPQPVAAESSASASTTGSAQVGMALPGATPQAAAVAGASDHDAVVGRLAVGYMGRTMAFSPLGGAGIPVPVVGVRYWLSDMVGIDAGVGFGIASGSTDAANGTSTDDPSFHAFMLHGGVPLSLASAGHFSFQIVPEMNLGFAGSSVTPPMGGDETSVSAFHLDLGARAGAEIHFGFIGVPQLSLQGSVGLRLNMDSTSDDPGDGGSSRFSLATTVGDNPWNIFTSNVAALYYF